jgi:tRNA G18 (ribose-2'-O)-methylase SpoU
VTDLPTGGTGRLVTIGDPADPRLADYRNLADPAGRRQMEAERAIIVVEGRVAVRQLLRSDHQVRSMLVDDHQAGAAVELVGAVRARGRPVYVGSREVVAATVGFALHRGVVAIAHRPADRDPHQLLADAVLTPSAGGGRPLVAVLEGLNDHENIGALFRNAAAFGVAAVLLDSSCADPLYRRSIRVSAGHVLQVPFARLAPWPDGLDEVRAAGFVIAALTPARDGNATAGHPPVRLEHLVGDPDRRTGPGGTHRPAADQPGAVVGPTPVALVLGAEGPGLSPFLLGAADELVCISMADGIDSLNVATAAAIAFHRLSGQ